MLIAIVLAGLAPGGIAAWRVGRVHGWVWGALAGVGVTVALVAGLLVSLSVVPGVAAAAAVGCLLAALAAFDKGRIWLASTWMFLAALFMSCAGWTR
jgi:hypothetical protein